MDPFVGANMNHLPWKPNQNFILDMAGTSGKSKSNFIVVTFVMG